MIENKHQHHNIQSLQPPATLGLIVSNSMLLLLPRHNNMIVFERIGLC